jgi:hypothetical protein
MAALPAPTFRNIVHALLSLVAMIVLTPFITFYSRRYERNLAKNHYRRIEENELRVAKPQFDEIAAQARGCGLLACGCFAQAPGTGSGREELRLWLNERRDVLFIAIVHRVWLFPKLLEVRALSHFAGGRTVATISAAATLNEISGLEDAHLCPPDFTLAQLLAKHEWRLAEEEGEPFCFKENDPLGDYEDLHWQRVRRMAEQGYVTIVDSVTTQWRYTPAGEAALHRRNRFCGSAEST